MEREKKPLEQQEADLAVAILSLVFPTHLGIHPPELHAASRALKLCAALCEIAAAVHEEKLVDYDKACPKCGLPKGPEAGLAGAQAMLAQLVGPLHVDIADPYTKLRGDLHTPRLVPAKTFPGDGGQEDLTALGVLAADDDGDEIHGADGTNQ